LKFRISAPAKINLALEVLGELPGGYHELDSVFATLDLADELTWQDASETRLEILGGQGLDISTGEDNLVLKALRSLEAATGRKLTLEISLHKHIPAGGGLGGGSADAAALLYGVNQSHHLGLSSSQLQALASPLGADVAFGVLGGVARGQGRGDLLTPLPIPAPRAIHLIFPPFFCPTGPVYRAWDSGRFRPARGQVKQMLGQLPDGLWGRHLGNDLEPAAERVQPQLREIRQALQSQGWGPVLLCGSGSTLSCWGGPSAPQLQDLLKPWGCEVLATRLSGASRN